MSNLEHEKKMNEIINDLNLTNTEKIKILDKLFKIFCSKK